jgi:hypothetical protein
MGKFLDLGMIHYIKVPFGEKAGWHYRFVSHISQYSDYLLPISQILRVERPRALVANDLKRGLMLKAFSGGAKMVMTTDVHGRQARTSVGVTGAVDQLEALFLFGHCARDCCILRRKLQGSQGGRRLALEVDGTSGSWSGAAKQAASG